MIANTPGGGGWGNPLDRAPELVLRDVRDGVVSMEAAECDYGVVISRDGRSVDEAATIALRSDPSIPAEVAHRELTEES